jgi:methionine-rich copper-binding protein CopC
MFQIEPNETIDQSHDLGSLVQPVGVFGSIGNGPAGAADVTWYEFELTDASRVRFNVSTPAGNPPFASVLSLYNNDPDDFGDPYDLDGHRVLAQVEASPSTGSVALVENLSPGDYFVAISGAGNLYFSPVIAGSGYDGATGHYELMVSAIDLGLSGDGPTIVSSDPAPGAVLDSSPLAIRFEMSGPLDPNTIIAGQTVQLLLDPSGTTGEGAGTPIALASVNFSATANELQLFPVAPLAPGHYTVMLAGDSSTGQAVLASPDGVPLGEDAAHPMGADLSFSFDVDGIDGVAGATSSDDTPATAQQLGNVVGAGVIHVSGAIGVDPSFNPNLSPDPEDPEPQFIPANQVDLYHFEITGPGRYAMLSEVFAGRIGSPLQPGISLFELDPTTGSLIFLAGDTNTMDPTMGTDGSLPLFSDSALAAGLTAGDYYLAVADASNTPMPEAGQPPGSPGIFDPNVPDSAQNGWNTGSYVLNVLVVPAPGPPQVIASSPASGQVLNAPPTLLTVTFSEPIDFQQLAFQTYYYSPQTTLPEVFVEGTDGTKYYPVFLSYDRATNQATFMMVDSLANGFYALHLSGSAGLTNLAGDPIVPNDLSGDFVIPFQVDGPDLGISGNVTDGYTVPSQAGDGGTQDLGVLFADELDSGLTIIRGPGPGTSSSPMSTSDSYTFQLLQSNSYGFTLSGADLPAGIEVTLTNGAGQQIQLLQSYNGLVYFAALQAGTYTVSVGGWSAGQSAGISYQLTINWGGQPDNAVPLVDGPTPLLQIQLAASAASAGSPPSGGSGAGGGLTLISLAGPDGFATVVSTDLGSLTSLGASPLGGAGEVAGMTAGPPVQIALNLAPSPGLGGLVSLITSIQVLPWSSVGEGAATPNTVEQPAAGASDGPNAELAVQIPAPTPHLDRPAFDPAMIGATNLASLPEPIWLAAQPEWPLSEAAALDQVIPPRADVPVVRQEENHAVDWVVLTRLVFTGAVVATAFWGRRAIRDLEWRKRPSARQPRPSRAFGRHRSHDSATVVGSPGRVVHAPPRVSGSAHWSGEKSRC